MGTIAVNPYLASVDGPDPLLPFHPTMRHPITGESLQAIYRTKAGKLVWPQMGGSQPFGGPDPSGAGQQQIPGQPMQQSHQLNQIPTLGGAGQGQPQQNGQNPYGAPQMNGQMPGQQQAPQQGYYAPNYGWPQGQPQQFGNGSMPQPGQPQQGQVPYAVPSPLQFAMQHAQPPQQGQPGQQPQGQQNGNQPQQGQQAPQNNGQQAQSDQGGQNGAWDRPYPQGVPVDSMDDKQKIEYWKYHSRKNEADKNRFSDYDQIKTQLDQLRAATATEWQRAQMEAEQRGAAMATQRAAAQLVQFAFQTAAKGRATPEAVSAQLSVLDAMRFTHNGQVNLDAVQNFVDTTWPQQQAQGFQGQQQLWMQQPGQPQLPGQPGMPGQPGGGYLQPGMPGYGQQPTFGPSQPGMPGGYGQPAYGQQPYPMPGQMQPGSTYPAPGVPQQYPPMQQQPQTQQVVNPAGMAGIPSLTPGSRPVTDFGQGAGATNPLNGLQAGASVAAQRHGGKTRSQQLAASNNPGR